MQPEIPWYKEIPIDIQTQRLKWITDLQAEIKIPNFVSIINEPITEIDINLFSDASIAYWYSTVIPV